MSEGLDEIKDTRCEYHRSVTESENIKLSLRDYSNIRHKRSLSQTEDAPKPSIEQHSNKLYEEIKSTDSKNLDEIEIIKASCKDEFVLHDPNKNACFHHETSPNMIQDKMHLDNHQDNFKYESQHTCDDCKETFCDSSKLNEHLAINSLKKNFKCEICAKSFSSHCYMKLHKSTHCFSNDDEDNVNKHEKNNEFCATLVATTGKIYECRICHKSLATIIELREHLKTHGSMIPFRCTKCNKYFFSRLNFRCHKRSHVSVKPHYCNICNKKLATTATKSKRVKHHCCNFSNKRLNLLLSKKVVMSPAYTKQHSIKSHEKTESMSECLAEIKDTRSKNYRNATESENVKLPLSDYSNTRLKQSLSYTEGVPLSSIKQQSNKLCEGIKSTSSENLEEAEIMKGSCRDEFVFYESKESVYFHHETRPNMIQNKMHLDNQQDIFEYKNQHACDVCKETFSDPDKLNEHLTINSLKKNFTCETCAKSFSSHCYMKLHKSTHCSSNAEDNVKKYERSHHTPCDCSVCYKFCATLVATTGKIYECRICHKSLTTLFELRKHLKTHGAMVPFKCTKCNKYFFSRLNFRRHIKSHVAVKPYYCNICKKELLTKDGLSDHMMSHTGKLPFLCEICKKGFKRNIDLKYHQLRHTDEKPFKCKICESGFASPRGLRRHKLKHALGEKRFQCDMCSKAFTTFGNFKKHKMRIHAVKRPSVHQVESETPVNKNNSNYEKIYAIERLSADQSGSVTLVAKSDLNSFKCFVCDICNKVFPHKTALILHRKCHGVKDKVYKCKFCEKVFVRNYGRKRHEIIHTGEKPFHPCKTALNRHRKFHGLKDKAYKCKFCEKSFARNYGRKRHEIIHTGKEAFCCRICLKFFTTEQGLTYHMASHIGEFIFECDICKKVFKKETDMKCHQLKHTDGKPSKCQTSERCFSDLQGNRQHKLQRTTEKKPFQCEMCSKIFTTFEKLQHHKIRIHSMKRPSAALVDKNNLSSFQLFFCANCDKAFLSRSSLCRHKKLHGPENKLHKCKLCNKVFTGPSYLKRHEKMHTGEKPFHCEICLRSLSRKETFMRHQRCHAGDPPDKRFKCETCGKAYLWNTDLKLHKMLHVDKTPFKCNFCTKAYAHPAGLRRHKLLHTVGPKPITCDICKKSFASSYLNKHKSIVHGKNISAPAFKS